MEGRYYAPPPSQLSGVASADVAEIAFGGVPVTVNITSKVKITNTGAGPLTLSSITASGTGFSQTSTCGALPISLSPKSRCEVTVVFRPVSTGVSTGLLKIAHNGSDLSPLAIVLSGTGEDFSTPLATPASNSVASGGFTTYRISTSPINGTFSSSISFSCATPLPVGITCSFSPARVTPGLGVAQTTLTVSTVKSTTSLASSTTPTLMPISLLLGTVLLAPIRKQRQTPRVIALTAGIILLLIATSCGDSAVGVKSGAASNAGAQPGTYRLMVIGNAGGLTHTAPITLMVR